MQNFSLDRKNVGLLVVDAQKKLFEQVERPREVMEAIRKVIKGCQILNIPIVTTEQYPQGLGSTICGLKSCFPEEQEFMEKTSFSCLGNELIKAKILSLTINQWIIVGIEAHVCILQTARDLINAGKQVVVLNDAITSRSIFDYSTAIAEMRDMGARISSTETVLFELLQNSNAPEFKEISQLVK